MPWSVTRPFCAKSGSPWKIDSGNSPTARDLDPELALQPEHDVEEVNRLRAQVPLQGGCRRQVVFVHVQSNWQGAKSAQAGQGA